MIRKSIIFMAIVFLIFSCSLNRSESTNESIALVPKETANRNYYLLVDGFQCTSHTPDRTVIHSWKNRLQFTDNDTLIWGNLCNDQVTVINYNADDFEFSPDFKTVTYKSEVYTFFENKPQLCKNGWWCPVEQK